ncbi:hypothetical protein L1987_65567 [Smallanthus sonchifolius]|uniref:Uncharacterized protein n=1 Tax=Smallanthus sonchifolius TaxID=185202 RepID=A0ACB9BUW1_9ASTR|nr:hypothetical protein L1987_65567 [Smallanthus sonchifolius]
MQAKGDTPSICSIIFAAGGITCGWVNSLTAPREECVRTTLEFPDHDEDGEVAKLEHAFIGCKQTGKGLKHV